MEVNREEAIRCLSIAQKHRTASNLPSALKFARKSVALFSTPEGEKMVQIIETEISISSSASGSGSGSGSGNSTPGASGTAKSKGYADPGPSSGRAKASGVEEHVSGTARQRPGHGAAAGAGAGAGAAKPETKKREYTAKQMDVVKRVKSCQGHQYYEILSVERTCDEGDIKRAYKKLALVLHPDKNGAPGADEAFKMVSKAFQILSDPNLRAAFDSNPHADPTQRGGGGGGGGFSNFRSRGGGGGGGGGGFGGGGDEFSPEDLFNAFFGGGMGGMGGRGGMGAGPFGGNVFTFGGPSFQTFGTPGARARTAHAQAQRGGGGAAGRAGNGTDSPLIALLPVILLCVFALLSGLPSLFTPASEADPQYMFTPSQTYDMARETWHLGVRYYVNKAEWSKSGMLASIPEERRGLADTVGLKDEPEGGRGQGAGADGSAVGGESVSDDDDDNDWVDVDADEAAIAAAKKERRKEKEKAKERAKVARRGGGTWSTKVRAFERSVENLYIHKLRNECDRFTANNEHQKQMVSGIWGFGGDSVKLAELRARRDPACEQLKAWGQLRTASQQFY